MLYKKCYFLFIIYIYVIYQTRKTPLKKRSNGSYKRFHVSNKKKKSPTKVEAFWQREKDSNGAAHRSCEPDVPTRSPLARQPLGDDICEGSNPSTPGKEKAPTEVGALWQREKDSNPHKQSQSLLCYLYTIPLSAKSIISKRQQMSTPFFTIFSRTVEKYFSPCYNA